MSCPTGSSEMSRYVPDMTLNYPPRALNSSVGYGPVFLHTAALMLRPSISLPYDKLPRDQHAGSPLPLPSMMVVPLTNDRDQQDGSTDSDTDLDEAFSITSDLVKPSVEALHRWRMTSGLSSQQCKKHWYLLHILGRSSERLPSWRNLVQHITSKWSHVGTRINWLGSALGAVKRRDMYMSHKLDYLWPIPAFIYDQLKTWRSNQLLVQNFDLPHIDTASIETIATSLQPVASLYLRLMFRTAQRSTSISKLQARDIFVERHSALNLLGEPRLQSLSIRFRDGKTITTTGAYTLHTLVSSQDISLLHHLASQHRFIFGPHRQRVAAQVSQALREAGYDVRACRRGALRHLAAAGYSDEALMLLSRHTSRQTLYKYLGAGLWLRAEAQTMLEMAQRLIQ